ncbi:replication/maintenance protein RepL [Indiicoccus explosivorum]|uniref:replication/maintenance protein RepL n=1 Tax=Indiicoccus explosivorum TaxID=1917864 RepID=UPI000B453DC7|nr:replication/maintenance protein RepL [Indiicoccus explosivorum]
MNGLEKMRDNPAVTLNPADVEKNADDWLEKLKAERPLVSHRDKTLLRYLLYHMDCYGHVVATLEDLKEGTGLSAGKLSGTLIALEDMGMIARRRGIILVDTDRLDRVSV